MQNLRNKKPVLPLLLKLGQGKSPSREEGKQNEESRDSGSKPDWAGIIHICLNAFKHNSGVCPDDDQGSRNLLFPEAEAETYGKTSQDHGYRPSSRIYAKAIPSCLYENCGEVRYCGDRYPSEIYPERNCHEEGLGSGAEAFRGQLSLISKLKGNKGPEDYEHDYHREVHEPPMPGKYPCRICRHVRDEEGCVAARPCRGGLFGPCINQDSYCMSGEEKVNHSPDGKRQACGDKKVWDLIRKDSGVDAVQGQNVGEGIDRNDGNESR